MSAGLLLYAVKYDCFLSETVGDADDDRDTELGEKIEKKVTYRQHIKAGIVGEGEILFQGYIVCDAHDDQCNEDQSKCALRAEKYREEDQDIGKADIDRRHRHGVERPQIWKLPIGTPRHHEEAERQKEYAEPKDRRDREECDERVLGEHVGLAEDQGDEHPEER